MRLSSKERAALRAMVEFARRCGSAPTSLHKVAEAQELPLPYLERVAAALREAGLLISVRGAHGGYRLSRESEAISVGDIFRAVEGSLMNLDCMQDGVSCSRQPVCAARSVWQSVALRLSETLDHTSLADVLRGAAPSSQGGA